MNVLLCIIRNVYVNSVKAAMNPQSGANNKKL